MADNDVTVSRTIHASTQRVWTALTTPELVREWMMGAAVESTWQPGATVTWTGEYNGKRYQDKGEVLEVEEGRRLVHTHFSAMSGAKDVPANYHRVSWRLQPNGDSTTLTLTQSGASSAKEAEQFKSGWRTMLDQLRDVAEKQTTGNR